ncbi:hypothetical protein [Dictyobacter formicarum]|uniref:Zinc ribbon domain-containing protein n=1 Tax=Dictyobacter formicarum TaxID=2778368 RepID=A0ABQ3VTF8_9CHLR|nr:hypothetical protein [Dictyobacter formicarum]GHO88984.1 hypothetical protein KSZ_69900 [Dictyobacter formicarum]
MIKCNRCGNMTPAGTVCQACGAPLAGMVDNGPVPGMGFQDQPELPAWLESLRAGERSATPPTNNVPSFSPSDLIEEGAFPSWMRSERGDARDNTAPNPPVSAHPTQFSDQAAAGGDFPSQGITAQSLIDEKSLPSWMQEGTPSGTPPPSPAPGGFSASSLVQPDNLPEWMRTLQPPPVAPKANPTPAAPQPQARPVESPASPAVAPGFSARDLVDQQSLPSWMQPQNEQGAKTGSPNPVNQNPSATNSVQSGFSASSLLDVNALPSWLREGDQNSGQPPRANNPVAPAPQEASWSAQPPAQSGWNQSPSGSTWPAAAGQTPSGMQAPMQTPPVNAMSQPEGGSLSAASFIDPNSLPEWLRSSSGQPANTAQPQGAGSRPGGYGVPPRADNMRVPSRPRGEVNPSESSELAANVFASMLGVASATPNYPAQQPVEQPGQPQAYGQNPSGVQNPYGSQGQSGQGNPYNQPGQANSYAPMGQPEMSQNSLSGMPNSGLMPDTPRGASGVFPQNYDAGNSLSGAYGNSYPGGSQGQNNPAMGANPSMGGQSGLNAGSPYAGNSYSISGSQASSASPDSASEQKSNKKRGLFEAIREWLSR